MIKWFLFISIFTSCGQDFNSNSFDKETGTPIDIDTSTPAGKRLASSYKILKANCMNCHTGAHNSWLSFNTDSKWQSAGLIVANDSLRSELIARMKNVGGDMPTGAPQISDDEFQDISDWIDGI